MSNRDSEYHAWLAFQELLEGSDDARAAVESYVHEAYERGVRVGHRTEHERLSRIIDGMAHTKGNHQ